MMNSRATINKDPYLRDSTSANWWYELAAAGLLRLRPAFLAAFLKKILLFQRKEITTPDGTFFVDIASSFGYSLFRTGSYEPHMLEVIKATLQPGSVFVDLGANEGYFSVIASKIVGAEGKVVAVEPQSRLQRVIGKNLSLNGCENVEVLPLAINDESKPLTLHLSPDVNTGSTSMIQTTRYPLFKQDVPSITLNELFQQQAIVNCDLLKVDIEGYEYEAIMGSPELFTFHRIKAIALELHPKLLARRNLSGETIAKFLSDCGYNRDLSFINTVFVSPGHHFGVAAGRA
jgi:FkbM family methyltransferase